MTEYFPRCQFIQDCTEGCHLASQPLEDPIHDEAALNPPAPVDISDAHEKIYTPINPWQTRLLRLLPRQTGQKIHVELHVADLIHDSGAVLHVKQEVVQYSALSYCWGPATPAASVICNEVEIRVTPNLYSALRRLRREEESVWLWADALCINQTDLFERSMQVTKMLLIYYKATAVVVWLGSSGEYTNLACEALRIFEPVLYDDDGWSTSEGSEASVLEEERNLRREGMWAGPQSESLGVARASAPRGLPLSHLGQNHDFPIQTTEQVFDRNRTKSGHRQTNRAAGRGEEPSTGHGSKHVQFGELGSQQSRHRDSDDSESSVSAGSWESDSEEGSIASFSSGDPDVDGVEVPPMILCFEHSRAVKAGLIDLLSRPYFQRLWVMQEVWAASGYLSVLCGPEEIHWSILTRASKLLNRLVSPMEWSTHKDRIGRLFRKFDEPTPLERMELVNGARSPGARSDYSSRVEYADGAGSLNNHDTVRLLNRAVGSQCSDPRDHIYALLGMSTDKSEVLDGAPSGNVAIPISYDRSTSQVFQDVMRYVMHRDGGLWILLTASTFGGEVDRVQLPSWCRDWRTPTSQGNATRWMKRLDRVRMSGPGQFFPNDTPILQVTGFRIAFAPESGYVCLSASRRRRDVLVI